MSPCSSYEIGSLDQERTHDYGDLLRSPEQVWTVVEKVQREPVVITRHGRATAYMVSPQNMPGHQNLQAARRKHSQAVAEFACTGRKHGHESPF
ncbi:type II toxin-antitoxin system Phd/YefM family antitoxin [Acidithiobacillus sp. 'AMD consortium']|jgi:hypothetical protein|nr:type II toxin-antitoxin system Phd/YefM family antitoxin [Acidithiobacillus sp. 'AMD consortium']